MKLILTALMMVSSLVFSGQELFNMEKHAVMDLNNSGKKAKGGNDCWGWTDKNYKKEIAIIGMKNKTSFVDITNPKNPVHLADLPTQSLASTWRDIKVYKNYAFVVSEAFGHGMQIYNMENLRSLYGKNDGKVAMVKADKVYKNFANSHNIFINEETGFAYAVGTNTCSGGLHIIDIKDPMNPKFQTCVGRNVYEVPRAIKHGKAYTHDVQCVVYKGPDRRYFGKEICVSSNEDTVNVVDVTDKKNPYQISVSTYKGVAYTHQGWLSEDHEFFILGDELDEMRQRINTKTIVWDFRDLENIKYYFDYTHPTKATDHNLYTKGNLMFQANYLAGVRVLDISQLAEKKMKEIAFIDTNPNQDDSGFAGGAWSVYPYFESGNIIASTIEGSMFVFSIKEIPRK